jgi:hypothetical protein
MFAGCGGGGGTNNTSGNVSYTAQNFFKSAVGNAWTLAGITTYYSASGVVSSTSSHSESRIQTSLLNGVVTGSDVIVTNGSPATPTTYTREIDSSGNLIEITSQGNQMTILPASYSLGTSWTFQAASGVRGARIATISALNVSRTVPAGTFTDCFKIDIAQFVTGPSTTSSNTFYFSPSTGTAVETTNYSQNASGVTTSVDNWQLQPGYVIH